MFRHLTPQCWFVATVLAWCGAPAIADAPGEQAREILGAAGVTGGLVVHLGCGDGQLTAALRVNDSLVVHGLDRDPRNVEIARQHIQARRLYGPVSVNGLKGDRLPYADNLVRLLVVAKDEKPIPHDEILRVLCPDGVAWIAGRKLIKPWPKEIDEWPQHFHGADNNAVSRDSVVGPPRHFQWIAEPEWTRSHLTLPSINSLVSSRGRLFTIEDQASAEHPALPGKFALVARDAFSGIVLWQHRFPDWQPTNMYIKFTPAQLQRQLAAIGETIYCTPGLDAPITAFEAASGKVLKTYAGSERTQEFAYDRGVLYIVIGDPTDTAGIGVKQGSLQSSAFPDKAYGPLIPKLDDPQSKIVAIEAESGRTLWERSGNDTAGYQGTSLAVRGDHAVYCTRKNLVCLDRVTGRPLWQTPVEISLDERSAKFTGQPGITVSLVLSDSAVYLADAKGLTAHALKDGKPLWTGKTKLNHFKAPDIFLAAGTVWTSNHVGYDPQTGQQLRMLSQKMTGPMSHDRCYRNRITERYYINTATGGSDFLALDGSAEFPNPWVRSTCGIGGLPCNGLYYAGPPACSCCNTVMLNALNALAPAPGLKTSAEEIPVAVEPRLETGSAYDAASARSTDGEEWPTYRHDAGRSGRTAARTPATLKPLWQTKLTTRASAAVIAAGKVFVADIDAHALCALEATDGKLLWRFTTGGRIDSPPTYDRGRLLFGSRDGWVYCLRAADGTLAWRFKALPDRLICAYGQLESAWPVCGSILLKDEVAYFAAGRNSFLDGGVFLFGVDPRTGRVLHQRRMYGPYGQDGYPIIPKEGLTRGFGLEGLKADILLTDGELLYLRHQAFRPDLTPVAAADVGRPHLITSHGFVEAIPHHRSFWTIDTMIRYDIATGSQVVHGDILVTDGKQFFEVRGYTPSRTASFDPRVSGYRLVAGPYPQAGDVAPAGKGGRQAAARGAAKNGWNADIPLTGKAMALAGDTLFVAGTPVAFPKDDLAKAYEGRMGGVLWAASASNGEKLAEYRLDASPVWDSLAVANGRVYLCTTDGKVCCFDDE